MGTLLVNAGPTETRVALLEDGRPVEVYLERLRDRSCVGNIYKGRVVRVLPGMEAAFVDVGLDRTAFLYVNDAVLPPAGAEGTARPVKGQPVANIADVVRVGQELLVQVQKEPMGSKGARVTRHLSLPGRYLVYLPFTPHVGVSQRIESPEERERLRAAVQGEAAPGTGFIVRTAAEGAPVEALAQDARFLASLWQDVQTKSATATAPSLVFEDLDLGLRVIRDLFAYHLEQVVVDDPAAAERVRAFLRVFDPQGGTAVVEHRDPQPLFDLHGVEAHLQRALQSRVHLQSGGSVVIEETEALTVVDVNSGRYVGETSLEETITSINLEAVVEVAHQLRLRNIGGIIIIDFIDMHEGKNRERVLAALAEQLRRDRVKTTIVGMSELGLVEMTRKRVRESLGRSLSDPCPYCSGHGAVKSFDTLVGEILRACSHTLRDHPGARLALHVAPELAEHMRQKEGESLRAVEEAHRAAITLTPAVGVHRERWRLVVEGEAPAQ